MVLLPGMWKWAIELLNKAKENQDFMGSSLMVARCYWHLESLELAHEEFQKALESKEAPAYYLQICMDAVANKI